MPYSHAAEATLAVPTPVTSVATTPASETILLTAVVAGEAPPIKIPLSPPKLQAAQLFLASPTPAVSVATTPVFETKLVTETVSDPDGPASPKPKIPLSPPYSHAPK